MINHVIQSVLNAEALRSKLTEETFTVPGFTSPKIRHLLNNICSMNDTRYLEVGVHKGATFVAANYGNRPTCSIAVDNWSEFSQDGESKKTFLDVCETHIKSKYQWIEQDCFTLTKEQFSHPINVYLYDGGHGLHEQYMALEKFVDFMDDEFIFMVDDWSWEDSQNGTRNAIRDLKITTLFEQELFDGWWNGFYISVLKKN